MSRITSSAIRWLLLPGLFWVACSSDQAPWQPEFCFDGNECRDGTVCDGLVCRHPCATSDDCPGDLACLGGVCVETCLDDDGCSPGEHCEQGVCVPLWGEACQPGERKCIDSMHLGNCHPDGEGWEVGRCPRDTVCLDDTCLPLICQPGERRCAGESNWETCNAYGTAFETGGTCDPGWTCHEGSCRLCRPGEAHCFDEANREICAATGDGWEIDPCPDGTVCSDGVCRLLICQPGDTVCVSATAWDVCNDNGTGFDPGAECATDETCYLGACRTACDIARIDRSSIGCVYYAVDTNPIHQFIDEGIGGDFAVALSNIHPQEQAHVLIECKEAGTWSVVPGGDLTVDPLDLRTVILEHRYIDASALFAGGAYRITSDLPLIAYQFNPIDGTKSMLSDASLLLPASSLDTRYLVAAWPQGPADTNPYGKPLGWPAHIQVVASAATEVRVTPSIDTEAGPVIGSLAPGVTASFQLEEGDFLQLSVLNHMDSFGGTIVESDEPVGVFSSNDCVNVPADYTNCCCEHLEEQLFGLQTWGKKYVAARAPRRQAEPCVWQILASQADTTVSFEAHPEVAGLAGPVVLDAGQTLQVEVNGSDEQPGDFFVLADKPVLVVQYTVGALMVSGDADQGDPSMVQTVPVEQYLSRYVILVPYQWVNDYLVLTRPAGVEVLLDGAPVEGGWVPVAESGYEVARTPVADGVHVVEGDQPFGIMVIGWDQYDSYAYPGGLNLQEINPQ